MKRERGNENESKNISKKHKHEFAYMKSYKLAFLDACRTGKFDHG